jgi:CspA family cold shock protein
MTNTNGEEKGAPMESGTVKWFNDERGYGFILPTAGGEDVFFHHKTIAMAGFRTLNEGDAVKFERGIDIGRGPLAEKVIPPERPLRRRQRRPLQQGLPRRGRDQQPGQSLR